MSWNAGGDSSWNDGGPGGVTWNNSGDAAAVGDFNSGPDYGGGDTGATNGHSGMNGGGGGDFTCRSCGEAGHKARECLTNPTCGAGNDGKCFNCGEEGHSKAVCPKPRVFRGECRVCKQVGHLATECPEKPAVKCYNCKEEGHDAKDCKNKRVFDTAGIEESTADEAWEKLVEADQSKDLDDIRHAFKVYTKAAPEATYEELEHAFRLNDFNTYLMATEKELPKTQTYINLQGELDKKYQVGFHLSDKPRRKNQEDAWPNSPEENLERLKDAGLPMDRGIPKCSRCDELGHMARACPEEASEVTDRVQVKCVNCDEVGHRARDCPTPRVDKFACRNCKQSGHQASECTEPRSTEGVECRKCNEMGHFSKDCPTGGSSTCRNCGEEGHIARECEKPRNPENVTCRNCDQMGHFSRDCPLPRDYSKVKCSNCDEMGHTKVRCKAPPKGARDDVGTSSRGDGADFVDAGGNDVDAPVAAGGGDEWETGGGAGGDSWETAPPSTAAGGW